MINAQSLKKNLNLHIQIPFPNKEEMVSSLGFGLMPNEVIAILKNESLSTDTIINPLLNISQTKIFSSNQMSVFSRDLESPIVKLCLEETIENQFMDILVTKGLLEEEAAKMTIQLLDLVGFTSIDGVLCQKPILMSFKQQQMLMIGIALAAEARVFLIDEQIETQDVFLSKVLKLKKLINLTIVLITNDLKSLAEYADRVVVIYDGEVVEDTDVETLFTNPKHPFTSNLINSLSSYKNKINRFGTRKEEKYTTNSSTGCRYVGLCNHKTGRCFEKHPELIEVEMGHYVRCYLYKGG